MESQWLVCEYSGTSLIRDTPNKDTTPQGVRNREVPLYIVITSQEVTSTQSDTTSYHTNHITGQEVTLHSVRYN